MNDALRKRLINAALALSLTVGGGAATIYSKHTSGPTPELMLAKELGQHYESSGKHIGTPYVDKVGKGQPLTVCAGVTGPEVVPGRYYTPADCEALELSKYRDAERLAKRSLKHWGTYNVWVRASFIDVAYNVPSALQPDTTLMRLVNQANDLQAACLQMPRWVYGTAKGVKVRLDGLVDRRGATRELCAEWGRDGHFSAELLAGAQ